MKIKKIKQDHICIIVLFVAKLQDGKHSKIKIKKLIFHNANNVQTKDP